MSLFVEIIKKRKNTTAPWELRAIQSVIKQNFLDSPITILKDKGSLFNNGYFYETPLTSKHPVDGMYGRNIIRLIKCEQWSSWKAVNVRVTLYSNDGSVIEKISGAKNEDEQYLQHYDKDKNFTAKWWPSQYNATFNTYNPSQKVEIPNISFSKPSEQNVLYRDENGFVKIS